MKREVLIHKVIITAEAKFDYEEAMELGKLPKNDIKNLIEDYLSLKDSEYQACDVKYFSVKYLDDVGGCLKLFLYKDVRCGMMQNWNLAGICKAQDWCHENETEGLIRHWLKQKTEGIEKEQDWVKVVQIALTTQCEGLPVCKIVGLSKEEEDGIKRGGSERDIDGLSFYRNANEKWYD